MEEALSKFVEYIEAIAPLTWEIALRQVQVQIVQGAIGLTFIALLLSVNVILLIKFWNEEDSDGEFFARCAFIALLCLYPVPTLLVITNLVGKIMNPEYYAIKILMELAGL